MRKSLCLLIIALLITFGATSSVAAPSKPTDAGILFGGQWSLANESAVVSTNLSDLPPVVEVYTATWCSNCVTVEHALDDIEDESGLHQYHIHRSINELQDPLGSTEIDQRFIDRYGTQAPPAVIFNGSTIKIGSIAESDSLEEDFTQLSSVHLGLTGQSDFAWSPTSIDSGMVVWSLDIENLLVPEGSSLVAQAWIVEDTARFEDGTNGLENYPHVVRGIIELDSMDITNASVSMSGNSSIALPPAYDDSDLSVHLLYQVNHPVEQAAGETECVGEACDTIDESLPATSLLSSVSVLIAVALLRKENHNA